MGSPSVDWLGVPLKSRRPDLRRPRRPELRPALPYGATEKDVLTFVSQQIAVAIDRKRAQEAVRESEERYRLLFERNLAGVYRVTLTGRILECNDALAHMFGYGSRDELIDRDVARLYPAADRRREFLDTLLRDAQPRQLRDARAAKGRQHRLDVRERVAAGRRAGGRGHRRGHGHGHHRAQAARGAAAAVPEDGGDRPARGRHRPRLQQPADDGARLQQHGAQPALAPRADSRGDRGDPEGRRARVEPDPAAARLFTQAALRAEACSTSTRSSRNPRACSRG